MQIQLTDFSSFSALGPVIATGVGSWLAATKPKRGGRWRRRCRETNLTDVIISRGGGYLVIGRIVSAGLPLRELHLIAVLMFDSEDREPDSRPMASGRRY